MTREALGALVAARLRLACTSFDASLAWSRGERGARSDDVDPAQVERAVARAARVVPGSRCLARALAARVLLRRRGHAPELRLGAGRGGDGAVVAHAWLEGNGTVMFGDPEPGRFRPFGAVPGETSRKSTQARNGSA